LSLALVLDAEPFTALAGRQSRRLSEVRAALEAARRLDRSVVTPAVVLAELYRGPGYNQVVDACLSRDTWVDVRATDRSFAKYVGAVLSAAGARSADMADAHVVAAAVEAGGGVILTGDQQDLARLAAAYRNIQVVRV
jgi:predicted nucleic acid-binding protein